MKIYILFLFFSFLLQAENSKFSEFGMHSEASQKMNSSVIYRSSMITVQKRSVDRTWLSEFSAGFSPAISGYPYTYTSSIDLGYQLHLNPQFSLGVKYSHFFHKMNQEGNEMIFKLRRIPLLLNHTPKTSYQFQAYWYPIYGKYVLMNQVIHFDIYTVASFISQDFNRLRRVPSGSLGLGLVAWWNKHLNSRIELIGQYYKYETKGLTQEAIITYANVSLGLLF